MSESQMVVESTVSEQEESSNALIVTRSPQSQLATEHCIKDEDARRKEFLRNLSKALPRRVSTKRIKRAIPKPSSKWKIMIIPISFVILVGIVEVLALVIILPRNKHATDQASWYGSTPREHPVPPSPLPEKASGIDPEDIIGVPEPTGENCWRPFTKGEDYRGNISTTISGKTCQRWDIQSPHQHSRTPSDYQNFNLVGHYCRNPDTEDYPWCFTTDKYTRWESCAIPECSEAKECLDSLTKGVDYRGSVGVTKSGKPCQDWTSQFPHSHSRTPENYPSKGLDQGYCRNPDRSEQPWCYTTDENTRWEECSIPQCEDKPGDCAEMCEYVVYRWVKNHPVGVSSLGVAAKIYPKFLLTEGIEVYCDCSHGISQAWMVIQRSMNGSSDFNRNMTEFVDGFGDSTGEFWLGLEAIRNFTNEEGYMMRIDLQDGNRTLYGEYESFIIGTEADGYTLRLGSYRGNADDTLSKYEGHALAPAGPGGQSGNKTFLQCLGEAWNTFSSSEMKIRKIS